MSKAILMRVNIAGFQGEAATIFGGYDPDTDVLGIFKVEREYKAGPLDGFLKVTNQTRDEAFDAVFTEEEAHEAVRAYFDMASLKLLSLKGDAARCDPGNKIERDGMDEGGMKYRFAPDIGNHQVAVLAACLIASRQRAVRQMADFAEEFRIITI